MLLYNTLTGSQGEAVTTQHCSADQQQNVVASCTLLEHVTHAMHASQLWQYWGGETFTSMAALLLTRSVVVMPTAAWCASSALGPRLDTSFGTESNSA